MTYDICYTRRFGRVRTPVRNDESTIGTNRDVIIIIIIIVIIWAQGARAGDPLFLC